MEVKEGVEEDTCYDWSTFYSVEVRDYEDLEAEIERDEMSKSRWAMSTDTLRREISMKSYLLASITWIADMSLQIPL